MFWAAARLSAARLRTSGARPRPGRLSPAGWRAVPTPGVDVGKLAPA